VRNDDGPARGVPWWAVASAILAPVFLIGGWTVAAVLQPPGYDPVRDTISELAGRGAADRWVMTAGIVGLGACYVLTAAGLRPASMCGRVVMAVGAVATLFVAVLPVPVVGPSLVHGLAAGTGFIALAVWPAFAWRRDAPAVLLRRRVSVAAAVVLSALIVAFAGQLYDIAGAGDRIGLTERVAAGAESLWPAIVVAGAYLALRDRSR
jgi:hypothetical membrane protein